jgi:hypothetical protein
MILMRRSCSKSFLVLLLFFPSVLLPAELDDAIKAIVATYQSALDALARGDAEAALRMDTDDWTTHVVGQQPRTKQQNAIYVRQDPKGQALPAGWTVFWRPDYEHHGTGNGLQLYDVQLKGTEAIVLGLIGGTHIEKIDGTDHQVWQGSHIRDTWVKTSAGWRRHMHEKLTINERMVDGKTAPADR